MRVLFVDDEPQILRGITRMLNCTDVNWDIVTANSGQEALEILAADLAEVVVSDMKMPGMDGAELLEEISRLYPEAVRIVLSGQAEKEVVYRAVKPMHQYLAKPCEAGRLRDTIARSCSLREVLESTKSHQILGRISSLPSLPEIYRQVVTATESDASSIEYIGGLVAQDVAMTAKILQLANSAIFSPRSTVTSPAQAASLIGLDAFKALVLSLSVFQSFEGTTCKGFNISALTQHSLAVGSLSRQIATLENQSNDIVSESFTAGLLHDVGKLILAANAADVFSSANALAKADDIPLITAEQRVFGLGHDGIGSYLLSLWGLPQNIIEAIAFHHSPDLCSAQELTPAAIVYFANYLVREGEHDGDQQSEFMTLIHQLGLVDRIQSWREQL
ncbi:MAG: response regulator [Fuerstiella sp.]